MVEAKKSDERTAELVASANVAVDKAPEDIPQPSIEVRKASNVAADNGG